MRYCFEEFAFDIDRRELHRGAEVVAIAPQVFDLLEYLIRNRERVVSKDELINAVWNGRIVSDAALTTRLNAVRVAIGDTGEEQRLIKTLHRFRFVGQVREGRKVADPNPRAEHCLRDMPNYLWALAIVAAGSALTGAMDRAREAIARGLEISPGLCISEVEKRMRRRRSEDIARMIEGLRKAGLPE
ncbi:DNA-binding winged helix-turn-helix (wHTH) protein [Bradyrhizobium japonicum]|nr:transcriptional regulator [Bradyrhizobium liaoningense]MCP1746836.1 DNA-binding winged helix-turn-helix (wHTH) protein [Bradyrhizobium japonicum]MBR1005087.1 transcriptional regulator [Bradyrhizobium liaoningense]MBR1071339.1 transcriptional regulator [Bradyrhizobium liaoningense]MCP1774474.1 DNA-binding winged helix-turn-helix (wHTH) protein [Bradyrhizobium japonicum]